MTLITFDHIRELVAQDNVLELARNVDAVSSHRQSVDVNGRGLLHEAVHSKSGDALQWLLDQGSDDVDLADVQGETPLMRAAWLGYNPGVDMLIKAGASLAATSLSGGTPLHFAYAGGTPAKNTVQSLVDAGADSAACDRAGNDPSSWKIQAEAREQGQALLSAGQAPKRLSLPRRG